MIGSVDVQLCINRQEEADGQRNGDQHAELCKPHQPGAGIGVARQGQEGNRGQQCREDGHGCYPPGNGSVAFEVFLALHVFFGKEQAGYENGAQVDNQDEVNDSKALHVGFSLYSLFSVVLFQTQVGL